MSARDEKEGRVTLETLEWAYAELTDGRALIINEDLAARRWYFDDGAEARSLDDAVKHGRALIRFAINQARQHTQP
jgi:hypothetical protein